MHVISCVHHRWFTIKHDDRETIIRNLRDSVVPCHAHEFPFYINISAPQCFTQLDMAYGSIIVRFLKSFTDNIAGKRDISRRTRNHEIPGTPHDMTLHRRRASWGHSHAAHTCHQHRPRSLMLSHRMASLQCPPSHLQENIRTSVCHVTETTGDVRGPSWDNTNPWYWLKSIIKWSTLDYVNNDSSPSSW